MRQPSQEKLIEDLVPATTLFCDVALPVPLDVAFTYRVPEELQGSAAPVVGGRVLVPFRQQRLSGVVVELHDRAPSVAAKNILSVLD